MRRLAFAAAVCGTLVLSACNDRTPTEPAVPPPAETFGARCGPLVLSGAGGIVDQINIIYAGTSRAQTLLRAAALAQAVVIKGLWDNCHPELAKKAAFFFIDWLNRHTPTGKETQVQNLILAILRGIGEVPGPTADGDDFGVGLFDPATHGNTVITTGNHHALIQLEEGSFLVPTEIVISRKAGDPPLTNFDGNQYPPTYDYNAINNTNNHVLEAGKTAIVAFCLVELLSEGVPGQYPPGGYAANLRIGHNPVPGAPGFPFELLDPVELDAGLRNQLNCPNNPVITSAGGGLLDFANAALRTAGSYLLPPPLWAANAFIPLPPPPPLSGKAPSLSSFKAVGVSSTPGVISNGTVSLGVNPEGQLNVFVNADTVGLGFVATGFDGIAHGCLCEGWGLAASSVSGYANQDQSPQTANLTLESFARTAKEATSVVRVGSTFRVTHRFRPALATPNLYQIDVTVENISDVALSGVVYRRVVDWDVEPTPFSEFVTIVRSATLTGVEATNNGFALADPLTARGTIPPGGVADFFNLGPRDHGAVFDLTLPTILPGGTKKFAIYYGAAGNTLAAKTALRSVGAAALSFARPNTGTDGTPNTFVIGFSGIGGSPVEISEMEPPAPPPPSGLGAPPALRQVEPTAQPDPRNRR